MGSVPIPQGAVIADDAVEIPQGATIGDAPPKKEAPKKKRIETPQGMMDAAVKTGAREAALGFAGGVGLPESQESSDFSALPGLAFIAKHPIDALKLVAEPVIEGHKEQFRKATDSLRASRDRLADKNLSIPQRLKQSMDEASAAAVHTFGGIVPMIGPAAIGAGEEIGRGIQKKDIGETAHGVGTAAGIITSLGLGSKKVQGKLSSVETGVKSRLGVEPKMPAAEALNAMIQGGNKVDTFSTAATAAPELQAAAKKMGIKSDSFWNRVRSAATGDPQLIGRSGNKVIRKVVDTAINTLEQKYTRLMQPIASEAFDGRAVSSRLRNLITRDLSDFAPQYAEALRDAAHKIERSRTMAEADSVRKLLNNVAEKFYAQSDMAQSSDLHAKAALADAADVVRDTLYSQGEALRAQRGLPPADFRSIKAKESSLMETKGRIDGYLNKLSGEQSRFVEPSGIEQMRRAGQDKMRDAGQNLYATTVKKAGLAQAPVEVANSQFGKVITPPMPPVGAAVGRAISLSPGRNKKKVVTPPPPSRP